MMIRSIAEPLVALLNRECSLYEALYRASEEEAAALRNADIDAMLDVGTKKERLVGTLRLIEHERVQMAKKLAEALGIGPVDPTLTRLAEAMGGPMASQLMACRDQLKSVAESIVALNNRTVPLLEHSRLMVRGTMAMIQHMVAPEPVYSARGDYGRHHAAGQLLSGDV